MTDTKPVYAAQDLRQLGANLFKKAGLPSDRAEIIAHYLLEADLMGHDTHGLNLAPVYLRDIKAGKMPAVGEPTVLQDRGPCATWDGHYMSGVWLTHEAIGAAIAKADEFGMGAVSIRRSHHIACLAAFLTRATDAGKMVQLLSSDPSSKGVAPFGAVEQCFTPNPIAVGYPTSGEDGSPGDPVLIDISASITTLGMSHRMIGQGGRLPGQWLIDNAGNPTDDPAVLKDDPPGALLPLGGMDAGHKGLGLALMVEALTSGLAGFGRADGASQHGASVFVLVLDPDAFGGADSFMNETGYLSRRVRGARVAPGKPNARLPGDGALARKRAALDNGVPLYPEIMPKLQVVADELGVTIPSPIG